MQRDIHHASAQKAAVIDRYRATTWIDGLPATSQSLSCASSGTQISEAVGKTGTARLRVSTGTLPVMAMVAACSISAASGPISVVPIMQLVAVSITSFALPCTLSRNKFAPITSAKSASAVLIAYHASRASSSVNPTDATCGSVKTTCDVGAASWASCSAASS